MELILRDGSKVYVAFDKSEKIFYGIQKLLERIGCTVDCCLLFEYFANSRFRVYILNIGGCEIEYPGWSNSVKDIVKLKGMSTLTWKYLSIRI